MKKNMSTKTSTQFNSIGNIATTGKNSNTSSDRLLLLFFHELIGGEYGILECVAPNSEQYLLIKLIDDMFQHSLAGGLLASEAVWEAAGLRAHYAAFLPVVMPVQPALPPAPVEGSNTSQQLTLAAQEEQEQEAQEKVPLGEALRKQRDIVHRQYLAAQNACLTAQAAADAVHGWRDYQFPSLAVQFYVLAWHHRTGKAQEIIENRCLATLFELASALSRKGEI